MNKKLFLISALVMGASVMAQAQYINPNQTITTVAQVSQFKDDTPVVLVGKIDNALGDEKYQFSDSTGTIVVEIDNDKWNHIQVTPDDTVQIRGEVDKGWFSTEIDVDEVIKQ